MTERMTEFVTAHRVGAQPDHSMKAPLAYSLGGHIVLVLLLTLHFSWQKPQEQLASAPVMHAQLVELAPPKPAKPAPPVPEPVDELAPEATPEVTEPAPTLVDEAALNQQTQAQEQQERLARELVAREESKRKALESEKLALAKKKKEAEQQAEKLKQDELKTEKLRKEKLELEHKKKLEAEKQKKLDEEKAKKEEAELKKKTEAERKRKESARKRQLEEDALAQEMEAESESNAARQNQVLTEVDRYKMLITNKIQRNWLKPSNPQGTCTLKLKIGPGGIVIDVSEGIGDPVLCRSAIVAVRKAEPLPVPTDPEVFEKIRAINLLMDPTKSL